MSMHKISKNENISHFDPNQIQGLTFDNSRDAIRVHVVDGLELNVDNIHMPELKMPEIKVIEVPKIISQPEIHTINVPVIVKEVQTVEVPVIVKEIEYRTIEVPVVVTEIKTIEIEKPIIIKETEFKELPSYVKVCMIVQAIATAGLLLSHIILKG